MRTRSPLRLTLMWCLVAALPALADSPVWEGKPPVNVQPGAVTRIEVAQAPTPPASSPIPMQLVYLGLIVAALAVVYLHLGTKAADALDAIGDKATTEHHAALVLHGGAAVLRALEAYAKANLSSIQALNDPATRGAALQHLEGQAKLGADPLLKSAYDQFGPSWLKGAADKLIDAKLGVPS